MLFIVGYIIRQLSSEQSLTDWIFLLIICAFIGLLGLYCIIASVWYDKAMAFDAKISRRFENKEREMGQEQRLKRMRRNEVAESIFWFVGAGFVLYLILYRYEGENIRSVIIAGILVLLCFFWALRPFIKRLAVRKGWTSLSERMASTADKEEQVVRKREKIMAQHKSDGTLIMAIQEGDIRRALEEYVIESITDHICGVAQLWQMDRCRFVVTFPCGVRRIQLMQLMDSLSYECNDVKLWVPSSVTKRTTGKWTLATITADDLFVAASDDQRQWMVPEDDFTDFLFQSTDKHYLTFQPRPDIDFSSIQKKELYY